MIWNILSRIWPVFSGLSLGISLKNKVLKKSHIDLLLTTVNMAITGAYTAFCIFLFLNFATSFPFFTGSLVFYVLGVTTTVGLFLYLQTHLFPVLEKFLRKKYDVNYQDENGATLLMKLVEEGQYDKIRTLLSHPDININIEDCNQMTAFIKAVQNRHALAAQLLMDKGASSNTIDRNSGDTVFIIAVKNGDRATMQLLINRRADVFAKDRYGETALIWAVRKGHREIVNLLVDKMESVHTTNNHHYMAFILATKLGKIDIVQALLGKTEIDLWRYYQNSLMVAAENGHLNIVEWLLGKGANVNDPGTYWLSGQSILMMATYNNHVDVVKFLLQDEIGLDLYSNKSCHTLDWALDRGFSEIAQALLDVGVYSKALDSKNISNKIITKHQRKVEKLKNILSIGFRDISILVNNTGLSERCLKEYCLDRNNALSKFHKKKLIYLFRMRRLHSECSQQLRQDPISRIIIADNLSFSRQNRSEARGGVKVKKSSRRGQKLNKSECKSTSNRW